MTISEANQMVINLLDDEDNAEEYIDRLPDFYDYAQKQIATTVDNIEKTLALSIESDTEIDIKERTKSELEKHLYYVKRIVTDAEYEHIYGYTYRLAPGEYRIVCCVYPETVTSDTAPEYAFEISPEAQPAIVYYAAAQACVTDADLRPYYAFMDRYNNILQNINDAKNNTVTVKAVKL